MNSRLKNKVAVVMGGSEHRLGTAQQFTAEGALVFITGRRQCENALTTIQGNVAEVSLNTKLTNSNKLTLHYHKKLLYRQDRSRFDRHL